jgi:membrane-associated phospholipid phosphatase
MRIASTRALALLCSLCLSPALARAQDSPQRPIPSQANAIDRGEAIDQPGAIVVLPTIGDLFRSSVRDLRSLPSWANASVLAGGLASAGALLRADDRLSDRLSTARWADGAFDATALTGQFALHAAAGLAFYRIGRGSASPQLAIFGADLVRAQILAQGTTQAIKITIGRTRPDGTSHSFPSGHSSTMFATATVLQNHFGWKAGLPAYAAAAYVAAGRIQTRRHYLSDVAFGAALGFVAGRTVTIGRGGATFSMVPIATDTGAGIGLTLVR